MLLRRIGASEVSRPGVRASDWYKYSSSSSSSRRALEKFGTVTSGWRECGKKHPRRWGGSKVVEERQDKVSKGARAYILEIEFGDTNVRFVDREGCERVISCDIQGKGTSQGSMTQTF